MQGRDDVNASGGKGQTREVEFGFVRRVHYGAVGVMRLLTTAAVIVQKCAVLPESAMASESGGTIVGGNLRVRLKRN